MIEVGQIIRVRITSTEGRVIIIDKYRNLIDIDWKRSNGGSRYNETTRYDLPHIESLLKLGTLILLDDLPVKNPNLLFKRRK